MKKLSPSDLQAIDNPIAFEKAALHTFRNQYDHCAPYRAYCDLINQNPSTVHSVAELPFLPISLFTQRKIITGNPAIQTVFRSSGTTGQKPAQHHISDLTLYEWSFRKTFEECYGAVDDYVILALLPSYLERQDASLVYMVSDLIARSNKKESGFYLDEFE